MEGANHTDKRAKRAGVVCRLATYNLKTAGKPGALFELGTHLTTFSADITALQEPYLMHGTPHEMKQKDIRVIAAQKKRHGRLPTDSWRRKSGRRQTCRIVSVR